MPKQKTPFYASKTLQLNALLIATAILMLLPQSFNLPEWALQVTTFSIGVLGILNRFLYGDITLKK